MANDELKKQMRREARALRDRLTPATRASAAKRLATFVDRIANLSADLIASSQRSQDGAQAAEPAVVSGFLPIGSEIDVAPLMQNLRTRGFRLALPVMVRTAAPLEFRLWQPGDDLVERTWGIREPGADCAVVEPDILLVPLLLFDRQGMRLGYGGGFYDRTLEWLRQRKAVAAVGVGFSTQCVDTVPTGAHDQRLDYLLTPDELRPADAL